MRFRQFNAVLGLAAVWACQPQTTPTSTEECVPSSSPPTVVREGVAVTLYNPEGATSGVNGFAVVRELRGMALQEGENHVEISDVASTLDPTSVKLRDPCLRSYSNLIDSALG